ncbi:MAG: outer membrane beta-barrel protein [Bacteroidota bacterium]
MKTRLTILLIFLCSLASVNAQDGFIAVNANLGFGTVNLNGDVLGNNQSGLAYTGGVGLQFLSSRTVSLVTGLTLEQKGANFEGTDFFDVGGVEFGTEDLRNRISYLTIPAMVRLSTSGDVKFYVQGGPYVSWLLQNRVMTDDGELLSDDQAPYQDMDLGLTGGVGILIPIIGPIKLNLEARHSQGFYNINTISPSDNTVTTQGTYLLFGVSLGG